MLTILGEPEEVGQGEIVYITGMHSGLGIDHVFQHVLFDERDRVTYWYALQH